MPTYCYKCPRTKCDSKKELTNPSRYVVVGCDECGMAMVRDYKAESASSHFHVTTDLYARKKRGVK